jgi:Ni2+-binding GTPase involved in maturation of urease and hydrogenase
MKNKCIVRKNEHLQQHNFIHFSKNVLRALWSSFRKVEFVYVEACGSVCLICYVGLGDECGVTVIRLTG